MNEIRDRLRAEAEALGFTDSPFAIQTEAEAEYNLTMRRRTADGVTGLWVYFDMGRLSEVVLITPAGNEYRPTPPRDADAAIALMKEWS